MVVRLRGGGGYWEGIGDHSLCRVTSPSPHHTLGAEAETIVATGWSPVTISTFCHNPGSVMGAQFHATSNAFMF